MKKEKDCFLDTSFLIGLFKENKKAIQKHKEVIGKEVTGTPCIYELSKFTQFRLSKFLRNNEVLKFTLDDAGAAGEIYYQLYKKGELIGEMDMVIGGMVKNRDLILITRDEDFKKIKGIELEMY